jgi:hypothetical protein
VKIVFSLRRAGIVVFVVRQVSPACRTAGTFRVHGHAGRNVVEFTGRIGARRLGPGTYRIEADARRVARITLVIVPAGVPTRAELATAKAANACPSLARSTERGTASSTGSTGTLDSSATSSANSSSGVPEAIGRPGAGSSAGGDTGGVLGTRITRKLTDPTSVSPIFFPFLAVAMALLALAALPRGAVPTSSAAALLTRRRLELALAGTGTLFVVVLAYLLT